MKLGLPDCMVTRGFWVATVFDHSRLPMTGLAFDLLKVILILARGSFIDTSRQQLARYAQESQDQQGHERYNKSDRGD
jgi:hypothetical protein